MLTLLQLLESSLFLLVLRFSADSPQDEEVTGTEANHLQDLLLVLFSYSQQVVSLELRLLMEDLTSLSTIHIMWWRISTMSFR